MDYRVDRGRFAGRVGRRQLGEPMAGGRPRGPSRRGRTVERWLPLAYFAIGLALVVAILPSVLRPPATPPTESAELSPDAPPDEKQEAIVSGFSRASSGTAGSNPSG